MDERITGGLRLDWPLADIWSYPATKAGPPGARCPRPCPEGSWLSPRMQSPPALWATCAPAQSLSVLKNLSWCSGRSYTEHLRWCPHMGAHMLELCLCKCRQRHCLVIVVANERNVNAHNCDYFPLHLVSKEQCIKLPQNICAVDFTPSVVT